MRVTEIFWSVQGEGTRIGAPTAFVRLTGCPLRCRWCDTAYAFSGGEEMELSAILARIREVSGDRAREVCVTGGEPLASPECGKLVETLLEAGFSVTVETSGALDIDRVSPRANRIVDMKCPGSGELAQNDYRNLARLTAGDEVKFVVSDRADFLWAASLAREHDLARRFPTWMNPVHGECDLQALAGWILESGEPFRLGVQLHKLVWGPEARGV